MTSGSGRKD